MPQKLAAMKGSRTLLFQRALIKWLSHSRIGSAFALANVAVLKGIPLVSLLIMVRRAWQLSKVMQRARKPFYYGAARMLFEAWAALEMFFWLYFRWKKQSLEGRRAYQPSVLWKAPGERKRSLLNVLENISRIHAGNLEERARAECQTPSATAAAAVAAAPSLPSEDHTLSSLRAAIKKRSLSSLPSRCQSDSFSGKILQQTLLQQHPQAGAEAEAPQPSEPIIQRLISNPSVENFLRFQDEPEAFLRPRDHSPPGSFALRPRDSSPPPGSLAGGGAAFAGRRPQAEHGFSMRSAPSVENLLRCWDDDAGSPKSNANISIRTLSVGGGGPVEPNQELHCLKHLELCSWYRRLAPQPEICSDVSEIRKANVEDWVLSYWFDGAESAEALTPQERLEIAELVDEVARWAGLPQDEHLLSEDGHRQGADAWEGRNTNLRCFRLRSDPFPAVHRPLFSYLFTAFLFPAFGNRSLTGLGFRVYRAGSTEYWFRPPDPSEDWARSRVAHRPRAFSESRVPLVFCHGIGVGPTMCLTFVEKLARELGKDYPIFLVDTAAVSMRFCDDVPSAREVAANMVDMLQVWGFRCAHFVGHSFGSFLLAWMLRYQRSYVERFTFMDPVCFLLLKVLVEGHELQQVRHETRMDTMEMAIKYFVLTELFVCNFVCRCFFWEESQLDMKDLEDLETLLVLEAEDAIVPTHSVQRLVLAERKRRVSASAADALAAIKAAAGGGGGKTPLVDTATATPSHELDVMWVEGQPHAGFLVDHEVAVEVCARLGTFHRAAVAKGG